MTKDEFLTLEAHKEKYNILYNLLDALGCDPVVSRLSPSTVDAIMRDLGSNRVHVGVFEDVQFDSAVNDYVKRVERDYKKNLFEDCEQGVIFGTDDYIIV